MPKLLLLDGHSLAYRAFFALPTDLATKAGTVTNAVYGFTSMLTKVMADEQPDHIAVAFDAPGGSTYRNELDPEYKAGRKETPDLFRSQLPLIHEVLEALEIKQLEIDGRRGRRRDRDARDPGRGRGHRRRDRHRRPRLVPARRATRTSRCSTTSAASPTTRSTTRPASPSGASASRPRSTSSTRRCAATRATTCPASPASARRPRPSSITTYGDLEGDLRAPRRAAAEAAHEPRRGAGPRVQEPRDVACSTATSTCGVEPDDLEPGRSTASSVRVLFNQLEFRTLLPRILDAVGDVADDARRPTTLDVEVVDRARREGRGSRSLQRRGQGRARRARAALGRAPRAAATVVGLGVSTGDAVTYIDADLLADAEGARRARARSPRPKQPTARRAPRQGARCTASTSTCRVARARHRGHGVPPRSRRGEVPRSKTSRCATSRSSSRRPTSVEGTLDLDGDAGRATRRGRRVAVLLRLADALDEALRGARARRALRAHRAAARAACSRKMEDGRRPHRRRLPRTSSARSSATSAGGSRRRSTRTRASSSTSTPRRSSGAILFEKLGLTPVKKTKTGPSTDADSLQKLAEEHPIVETLLRYREVEKLRSTYADALPPLVRRRRPHPRDVQPARDHDRPHLVASRRTCRTCRCARRRARAAQGVHRRRGLRPAHRRLLADRAARARAPRRRPGPDRRVRARRRRAHHHRGARCSTSTRSKVDEFQRRFAKVVNYGLAYGMEAYGLAQRLDIPTDQAREILDAYFAAFPNVAALHDRDDPRGEGVRLHDHAVRPPPPAPRAVVRQLPHPPDGGADGAERAGAGHARPTSSSWR